MYVKGQKTMPCAALSDLIGELIVQNTATDTVKQKMRAKEITESAHEISMCSIVAIMFVAIKRTAKVKIYEHSA